MSHLSTRRADGLTPAARLFLGGFFLTNVGNGMYTLAIGQLLYQLTGSVIGYALVVFSEFAFKIIFQEVRRVDDIDPITVCRSADICRAAVLGIASLLMWWQQPYLSVILATVAINFFKPFYISAAFRLAAHINRPAALERYNAGFIVVKQSGYLIGIGLYGLALHTVATHWVLLANLASYLCMLAVLSWMRRRVRPTVTPAGARPRARLGGGWRQSIALAADRSLLWQSLLASHDPLLIYLLSLFLLSASENRYSADGAALAWLQGAFVVGTALSPVLVRTMAGRSFAVQRAMWTRLAVAEVALVGALFAGRDLAWTCICLLLLGAVTAMSASYHMARLMRQAPAAARGRVAGLQLLIVSIMMLASLPIFSYWLDHSLATSVAFLLVLVIAFLVSVRLAPASNPGKRTQNKAQHE